MKTMKIILTSPETHGGKRIGVNGIDRLIPYNQKVEITEAEYEVLQNADLGTARVVDQADDEDTEADVHQVGYSSAKEGTEASPIQAPATPAETSSSANPLMSEQAPADELKGGDVQLREDSADGGESQLTEKTGGDAGDQPAADEKAGDAKGEEKKDDDAAFLDRPINQMDLSTLTDAGQIDRLIAAEQKRNDPRSTLIEKLEARKSQLGE